MNKISEIFLHDSVQALVQKAAVAPRGYHRQNDEETNINIVNDEARFKLQVWFKDGNRRTFYSLDYIEQPDQSYIKDEFNGCMKLARLISSRWSGKVKTALIYAHTDHDPDVNLKKYNHEIMKFSCSKGTVWSEKIGYNNENLFYVRYS